MFTVFAVIALADRGAVGLLEGTESDYKTHQWGFENLDYSGIFALVVRFLLTAPAGKSSDT